MSDLDPGFKIWTDPDTVWTSNFEMPLNLNINFYAEWKKEEVNFIRQELVIFWGFYEGRMRICFYSRRSDPGKNPSGSETLGINLK